MDTNIQPEKNPTKIERQSAQEVAVTRLFDAPPERVFAAWAMPELFRQWWVPQSSGASLLSCEMDVRAGGGYRLEFGHPAAPEPMAFFGRYLEVTPGARMVWTNEENGDEGQITTVTFAAQGAGTLVTVHECHPSKDALDTSMAEMCEAMSEQFAQLDALLRARTGAEQP